jgi:hypothetical protein
MSNYAHYNDCCYDPFVYEEDITYGPCGPCFPPNAAAVKYIAVPEVKLPEPSKTVTFTPQDRIPPKDPYKTCNICFEAIADSVLEPCSRNTFCSMCINGLSGTLACPLCRETVTHVSVLKPHNFDNLQRVTALELQVPHYI